MKIKELSPYIKGKVLLKVESYSGDRTINRLYFTDKTYLLLYVGNNDRVFASLHNELGEEIGVDK
jgi:hypothetical protein